VTPLAAAGLAVIMAGAVVLSLSVSVAQAIVPFVVGLLCLAVVHGRRRVVAVA
jgi:hypothetical protein